MKLTNKFNLPEPLVNAVRQREPNRNPDQISVSSLLNPPLIRQLSLKHWEEMEDDASNRIFALMGSATHYILENIADESAMQELFLEAKLNGVTIRGMADLIDADGTLSDYKITSVWSFMLGEKKEWINQLNTYAWLCAKNGIEIKKLQVVAILRDWAKSKAKFDPKYPQCNVIVKEIKLHSIANIEKALSKRIALHVATEPEPCTPEERWAKPDQWAVKKKGAKRATKLYDNEKAAYQHLVDASGLGDAFNPEKDGNMEIMYRPGEDVRCESYCSVKNWCDYYQRKKTPF